MPNFVIELAQGLMTLMGSPAAEPVTMGFFGISLLIVGSSVRRRTLFKSSTAIKASQTKANTPIVHAAKPEQST